MLNLGGSESEMFIYLFVTYLTLQRHFTSKLLQTAVQSEQGMTG